MPSRPRPSARLAALLAVLAAACSSGTEPPVATSVQVRTASGASSATLASIGQTVVLVARVLDQNGDTMSGQTVTWSSSSTAAATVSNTGTVTAVANGSSQITATAGSISGSLPVTVAQAIAQVQKQGGDGQGGTVGTALSTALTARVVDALGAGVANATVTWAVATGGGSVIGGNADASGVATATWTPGNTAGSASVTATSGGQTATFTATLQPGPVAQITIAAGNNQIAATGAAVPVDPVVRVADQFGNARAGVLVTWTVTAGGGAVQASAGSASTSTTNASGEATVVSWTLGGSVGTNTLQVSAGAGVTVDVTATGANAGAPANIAVLVGNDQTALVNFPTNVRPAVLVTDANALPVSGAQVVFTPSAGGSVTGGTVTTNTNGVAQVGSWTPGASAGAATVTAAVTSTALSQGFSGTAVNAAFNIEIRNVGPAFSAAVQAAMDSAEARWERTIYGDQADVPLNTATFEPGGACGIAGVTINETVDDIIILAKFDSIDGPSKILGQAGDCGYLRSSNGLAILGQMRFDTADIASLGPNLPDVILHEMGHVLGFASSRFDLTLTGGFSRNCIDLQTTGSPPNVVSNDTHFTCTAGRVMFDSIGGTNYTGGNKVPLENCATGVSPNCGGGTYNSHWREATFFNELMTGYYNSGSANPFSVLTIAAYEDLGYQVNNAAASAYSRVFTAPAVSGGRLLDFTNDVIVPSVTIWIDGSGAVRRVTRR
jgi:hypothetical protein